MAKNLKSKFTWLWKCIINPVYMGAYTCPIVRNRRWMKRKWTSQQDQQTGLLPMRNKNKTRDKGLLVGWMTRAVVRGDASTLGMAGLDFTRMMLLFPRWVLEKQTRSPVPRLRLSLLSFLSGPNQKCLHCVQIEGSSETIPPKHAFHWALSVSNTVWLSKKDLSSYKTGSKCTCLAVVW